MTAPLRARRSGNGPGLFAFAHHLELQPLIRLRSAVAVHERWPGFALDDDGVPVPSQQRLAQEHLVAHAVGGIFSGIVGNDGSISFIENADAVVAQRQVARQLELLRGLNQRAIAWLKLHRLYASIQKVLAEGERQPCRSGHTRIGRFPGAVWSGRRRLRWARGGENGEREPGNASAPSSDSRGGVS